jgi:hypothetical protein
MITRKLNLDQDYQQINKWLIDHKSFGIDKDLLSDFGFMISDAQKDIVAGFLYKTNSKVCYIENFISNPNTEKQERRQGIRVLFETIINAAKTEGYKLILTFAELNSLIKELEDLEFKYLPSNKVYFRSI